jgi:hypothetical protein
VSSAVDTVIVTTFPNNPPPIANAGSDRDAVIGDEVVLDGSLSSDVNGDALMFAWSFDATPAGSAAALNDADAVQANFIPDAVGVYVVRLTVDDGRGGSAADTVMVATVPGNRPPIADAGADQSVIVSDVVTLDGTLSADADTDPLTYRWSLLARPTGSVATLANANLAQSTFVVDRAGDYVAQLIVNDGTVDSAPDTALISSRNTPPVARAGDAQSATVGDTVLFDGSASSDANGDALAFMWSITARPPGSSADLLDSVTPTPALSVDAAGLYAIQLIVNDGTVDSLPDSVLVTVEPPPNLDPVAQNDSATTEFETSVSIAVLANDTDPDGDPITLESVSMPAHGSAAINGNHIDYTPAAGFFGADTFSYTVTDDHGGTASANVSVTVQSPVTRVTVVSTDDSGAELGNNTITFTFSRSGDTSAPLTVLYAVIGTATNGVDYQLLPGSVVIPSGAASAPVIVVPIADAIYEGTEHVLMQVAASANYVAVVPAIASASITDSVVVTLVATDSLASEAGPDAATLVITRVGDDLSSSMFVGLTSSGTASARFDVEYGGVIGSTLASIPAGQASITFTITPLVDNVVEGMEELTVSLVGGTEYTIGTPSSATISIADDPATISVVASDASAAEAGRDPGVFTFTRSGGDIAAALTVQCDFSGTAANSGDFVFTGCGATFAANQTTATMTITPQLDNSVEGDETVIATMRAGFAYTAGSPASASLTIADDPVLLTMVASDPDAAEEGPDPGAFSVSRSGGNPAAALTVIADRGGTATRGVDYTPNLSGVITIPANQLATEVVITPVDDALVEGTETATLTVRPSSTFTIVGSGTATVSIADNDP